MPRLGVVQPAQEGQTSRLLSASWALVWVLVVAKAKKEMMTMMMKRKKRKKRTMRELARASKRENLLSFQGVVGEEREDSEQGMRRSLV